MGKTENVVFYLFALDLTAAHTHTLGRQLDNNDI